jgi:sec-independent protein translocase protein TatA
MPLPNIGPGELILILIIALVVLGPGKLPDVAQSLGKSVREFRKAATDITDAGKIDAPAPSEQASPPAAPMVAQAADPASTTPAVPSTPAAAEPATVAPAPAAVDVPVGEAASEAAPASSTRDPNLS